ncbi:hypothetical protein SCLCIDRAFT_1117738 [Scleroderma citrinum Foug A]|uniref:Uncharacterized protein n=1 Tax=Scleroderma citrinum Foug A TaxID=1036808 RepID=A0A0C3DNK7_9AGAM|nr:hypothetical protein SCLCIDRAFT_1117738 [Scleroderma citrinum Foug A]
MDVKCSVFYRGTSSSKDPSHDDDSGKHACQIAGQDRSWNARRRDPRVNGADLYVVRVTKSGVGTAQPCWRCVRWCVWSGVRRIFHWNPEQGKFDVRKVNQENSDFYQTQADAHLHCTN